VTTAPIAHPAGAEALDLNLLELAESAAPPGRRHAVVTATGRVALVAGPLAGVALAVDHHPSALLLAVCIGALALVRGIRDALPPAVRFPAVTGIATGIAVALGATLTVALLAPDVGPSISWLLLVTVGASLAATGFEACVYRLRPPLRVLVVGGDTSGRALAEDLFHAANPKLILVGLFADSPMSENGNRASALRTLVVERRPDLVVLTDAPGREEALDGLLRLPVPNLRVVSLDHFNEYAFGRVSAWSVSPLWFMSLLHAYRRPYRSVTKRGLDLALAAGLLAVMWPVMLVIGVLVKLSSPGPVLYRQVRVGEAGVPYEMLKFRTMTDRAEADGKAAWAGENDPRITRVGRRLRRYRLDELPQIWNVLRGEMSFVGPRPERPEFVEALEKEVPHWSRRLLVKPGLTGWAQICSGYTADAETAADKLSYDLFYIKYRGLLLDLAIVARTASVVVLGKGAR
jgi:exopolysaccharide biosynthesis polyprenyl glycosylphosphotransferase